MTEAKQSSTKFEQVKSSHNKHRNLVPPSQVHPKRIPSGIPHQSSHSKDVSKSSENAFGTQELMQEIKQLKVH